MASTNALELFSDISLEKSEKEFFKSRLEEFNSFNSLIISELLLLDFSELSFFISSLISIKKSVSSLETSFFSKNHNIKLAINQKIEVIKAVFNQFNNVPILFSISFVSKAINHKIIQIKVQSIQITVTKFLSLFTIATYIIRNAAANIIQ